MEWRASILLQEKTNEKQTAMETQVERAARERLK
jgi:hypothetical protein